MRTKVFAALAIALGASILVPALAFGHADYDHSTPNDGETVTSSPARVDAFFSAEVDPTGNNSLNVTNASGADVDNNDLTIDQADATHMSVTLQAALPSGVYTVAWATTSAEDGEDDDGTFTFTIASSSSSAATATPAAGAPTTGYGPDEDGGSGSTVALLFVLATAGALALSGGVALRVRARRD